MSNKELKPIPKFNSEEEERVFWETHDSSEYVNWNNAEQAEFPVLEPTIKKAILLDGLSLDVDIDKLPIAVLGKDQHLYSKEATLEYESDETTSETEEQLPSINIHVADMGAFDIQSFDNTDNGPNGVKILLYPSNDRLDDNSEFIMVRMLVKQGDGVVVFEDFNVAEEHSDGV